jgi:hypothetical protein
VTNQGPEECTCRAGFCFCNFASGSITVYAPGSKGDSMPIDTISGENTGLGLPNRITLDSNKNIYVLNGGFAVGVGQSLGGGHASDGRTASPGVGIPEAGSFEERSVDVEPILIFAAGSNGDAAPIGGIGGPFTGLYGLAGIAIGPGEP